MNLSYHFYRLKYNYGRHIPLTSPVDISLELSSYCQLHCEYCYHSTYTPPFKKAFMSQELAEKIITQAASLGVHSIKFNWRGESVLHPEFYAITRYAKFHAEGMTFMDRITNSNFQFNALNEKTFLGLCNQTKVKVSFDSFNKKVFEAQRKGGNWDAIRANILAFHDHPKRKNTKLIIQAVRTNLNKDEDLKYECSKYFPDATLSVRDMVAGRTENDTSKLENKIRDASNRKPCKQAFIRLIFNHDGIAFPCCPDIKEEQPLGDIKTTPMEIIFNNATARALRKALKNKTAFLQNPCLNCSSFESYKNNNNTWDS